MFEKATRLKVRFATDKGNITIEDLWDLPLTSKTSTSLDSVAKSLNKSIKEEEEESFVVKKTAMNNITTLKFSIVKHVIAARLAEIEAKENDAIVKAKKEKIIGILAAKEDHLLETKSVAKLKEMLAEIAGAGFAIVAEPETARVVVIRATSLSGSFKSPTIMAPAPAF